LAQIGVWERVSQYLAADQTTNARGGAQVGRTCGARQGRGGFLNAECNFRFERQIMPAASPKSLKAIRQAVQGEPAWAAGGYRLSGCVPRVAW
jgi:hypothetical protein